MERTLNEIGALEEERRIRGDAVVEVYALERRDVVFITDGRLG